MSNARKKRKKKTQDDKGLDHLARVKAEALKVAEEPMADVEAEELTDEEIKELVKVATDDKQGEMAVAHNPFGGAQSWDELDEYIEAEATGDAIRETEWEFRKMMNNVLNDETMTLDQKSDKIAALADGFPKRADQLAEDKKDDEFDALAKVLNFLGLEDVAKRRMTRAAINDLPDSAFAFIEPGGKKVDGKTTPRSLRHLPIHDAAHVRNALARAAQMVKRGGKSAKIARSAMPKIRAKAKKLKIGKASGFIVQKDLEGNPRWFGWVSNKYRDRDFGRHPKGEIIAEAAHREFIEYVYADPKNRMPQLWLWHTFGTAMKSRADWIDYADGFLLESGPLTEKEGESFEALGEKHDLAMSHGFFKDLSTYDKENGVINRYRQIEASVLPRDHVANEWTDFATLQEVKDMFTPDRREVLVDFLGEEKVVELESSTKDVSEELKVLGVEFKEQDPEEKPKEEAPEDEGKAIEVSIDAKELIEKMGLPALSEYLEAQDKVTKAQAETIKDLVAKVAQLTKSDDEKMAEKLSPKAADTLLWLRPSEAEGTELKEDDKLADSKPAITTPTAEGWVTDVMGGKTPVASAEVPKS